MKEINESDLMEDMLSDQIPEFDKPKEVPTEEP